MILYRLANKDYIEDREGIGAKLFGGRWNEINYPCLYASATLSLALLEKFVHAQFKEHMRNLAVLEIEIVDKNDIFHVDESRLQKDWTSDTQYTQWIGKQLLEDITVVAFSVPSVIVPSERNYVINTQAVAFNAVKFKKISDFFTDNRLMNSLF
ncbi:RES family NAD+ phosphorylase [Nubsella zeaxanthinifaciens]|uniref:RES family NAD+ phosphorylase n=1 Tax=Nubsella zeaxanthinifaciens TaxID=392412 RepID=UPI000DE201D9|nr:RES family NAD+ phosphorylase [Nubsella zeaxanthinifaciens]